MRYKQHMRAVGAVTYTSTTEPRLIATLEERNRRLAEQDGAASERQSVHSAADDMRGGVVRRAGVTSEVAAAIDGHKEQVTGDD